MHRRSTLLNVYPQHTSSKGEKLQTKRRYRIRKTPTHARKGLIIPLCDAIEKEGFRETNMGPKTRIENIAMQVSAQQLTVNNNYCNSSNSSW